MLTRTITRTNSNHVAMKWSLLLVGCLLALPHVCRGDDKVDLVKEFLKTKAKAEQGDVDAQYQLAKLYKAGKGVAKSDQTAVQWYRAVASQKDARGQSMLGVMYTNGLGVDRDYDVAIKWFMKAAAQDSPHAKYNLGYMHAVGKGVPSDQVKATDWYRKAAELDDAGSQRILGLRYARGQGVDQDFVLGYAWTHVVLKRGGTAAKKQLESISKKMTAEQITEAKRNAKEIAARLAKLAKKK